MINLNIDSKSKLFVPGCGRQIKALKNPRYVKTLSRWALNTLKKYLNVKVLMPQGSLTDVKNVLIAKKAEKGNILVIVNRKM